MITLFLLTTNMAFVSTICAVTDGDASMWKKFQPHLAPGTYDPHTQFCDWHKGQHLKKEGEGLLSLAQNDRIRRGQVEYDDMHKLGSIFGNESGSCRKFNTLFGPLLHVVRRHESERVVELFWNLFTEKASGCGMFVFPNSYEKLHHYKTGTSGRYGMCTFVSEITGRDKYGCGVTANSIEARANKNIKSDEIRICRNARHCQKVVFLAVSANVSSSLFTTASVSWGLP